MAKKKSKKTEKSKTKEQKELYKRKALGLILGLLGLFLLMFVIFFTISRVFRPEDLSNFVPADSTVALMQVNVNEGHEQVQRFFSSLDNHDVYQYSNFISTVENLLNEDFDHNIKTWLNRQVGVVFLEKPDVKGEVDVLFFAETKDKGETVRFMESRGLENNDDYLIKEEYKGTEIYRYSLSQSFKFSFVNNYLIVGNNESVIKMMIDTHEGDRQKLSYSEKYQKISQNLPINNLIFAYADAEKMIELLKGNENFMSEKGRELLAFEPFLKIYRAFGVSFVMENDNLAAQTFTSLNENYLEGEKFITFESKFRAEMLEYLPENTVFYAGGLDLKKQIYRLSELLGAGGEVSNLIFEGMLRAQKNKYFGEEIKLDEDIYPLLEGEYAFSVAEVNESQAVNIILELQDPVNDRDRIESITDSFIRKSAILAPRVVEVDLEDGTISQEIQTVAEEIKRSTADYMGYEINSLVIGEQPWGIHYIILDDKLAVSSKNESLKKIIDNFSKPQDEHNKSVKETVVFREIISPVLRTSDEVMYIKTEYLLDNLMTSSPDYLNSYLKPFTAVSSGKNYFKDGISTIHYIKID